MKLQTAKALANAVIELLKPACIEIEVAGGVRRQKAEPHDIEIVCLPKIGTRGDLFGTAMSFYSPLEELLSDLLYTNGVGLALDQAVRRNGQKYKRLTFHGEVVELFIADMNNYGNIMAIRTGDAEFSHALVTPRRHGGLMPAHLAQHSGYLWRGTDKIACPSERDFFRALSVQWIEPPFRNLANARNLARHVEGE